MGKKIVVKKKVTAPTQQTKKVVIKKRSVEEAPRKFSPLPPRISSKYHLGCYHGTPPPWLTKEQRKDWKTGTWFVIETAKEHYAMGTEKAGYATKDDARNALAEIKK